MSRDEILAMEPAELSLMVAEKIFQARIVGNDRDPEARALIGQFKDGLRPLKGSWRNMSWRNTEEKAWLDCPKYAEDISLAWLVVEVFHQVNVMKSSGWKEEYDCRIWVGITGEQWSAVGKTAPEAICKAALLTTLGADNP